MATISMIFLSINLPQTLQACLGERYCITVPLVLISFGKERSPKIFG